MFLKKANPSTQAICGENPELAVTGDYPTLKDLKNAYGKNFAAIWLVPQIDNLTIFTGAKNITEHQHEELARIIAAEYGYLKFTELLLFFHRFKAGRYGRFYGSVDPMIITCALCDFLKDRKAIIYQHERKQKELERADQAKLSRMTYEEYIAEKNKPNNKIGNE